VAELGDGGSIIDALLNVEFADTMEVKLEPGLDDVEQGHVPRKTCNICFRPQEPRQIHVLANHLPTTANRTQNQHTKINCKTPTATLQAFKHTSTIRPVCFASLCSLSDTSLNKPDTQFIVGARWGGFNIANYPPKAMDDVCLRLASLISLAWQIVGRLAFAILGQPSHSYLGRCARLFAINTLRWWSLQRHPSSHCISLQPIHGTPPGNHLRTPQF
jgi:hypothetical protein